VLPPETWETDPFVRDWVMVNELANFSLKAITLGGERAYALINDQILEEGDVINGKKVVKIESEMVTLEQGGRTFTLLLGE
jgi:type II secretory pathway component PulC